MKNERERRRVDEISRVLTSISLRYYCQFSMLYSVHSKESKSTNALNNNVVL